MRSIPPCPYASEWPFRIFASAGMVKIRTSGKAEGLPRLTPGIALLMQKISDPFAGGRLRRSTMKRGVHRGVRMQIGILNYAARIRRPR